MAKSGPVFGAHRSIGGGFENAFQSGRAVGCACLQIFVKNQRQWRADPLTEDQIARYRAAEGETGLAPVIAHASYLLNLASPDERQRRKSVVGLIDELERCEALGVSALAIHPGAHMDDSLEAGIDRVAKSLSKVHGACPGYRCMVLLETTAGQGSAIGWRFDHLAEILDRTVDPDRLGICLDTCHLFAAGYDFRTPEGYAAMMDELESVIGLAKVKCIHVNDSKREAGSRIDRHEHIGKGRIGKKGFIHFVNDRRFAGMPMIIETPKGEDGRGTDLDKVNLRRLRSYMQR
jgi:deoxyribonuclease-4